LAPQARLEQLAAEAARDTAAAARAAAEQSAADAAAARGEAERLQVLLAERDGELAVLRGQADEGVRARAAREARMEADLAEAR
jgi:hypothetical protein